MMSSDEFTSGPIRLRAWLIYVAMLAGAIGLFFLINAWGMRLEMPGVAEPGRETGVAASESPESSGTAGPPDRFSLGEKLGHYSPQAWLS